MRRYQTLVFQRSQRASKFGGGLSQIPLHILFVGRAGGVSELHPPRFKTCFRKEFKFFVEERGAVLQSARRGVERLRLLPQRRESRSRRGGVLKRRVEIDRDAV